MHQTSTLASGPKAALLVSLLLAVVLAGCVDQADDECVDGVCATTPRPGETFLTNATRPTASLNECRGIGLGTNVPPESVRDELPEPFYAQGLIPETAQLQIYGVECQRIVINGTAAEGVRLAYTSVDAAPYDREWQGAAPSAYIFQYYADDESAVSALAALGLPTMLADIGVERTTSAMVDAETWRIQAEDHSFSYTFFYAEGAGGGSSPTMHLWSGENEFRRFDVNLTFAFTAVGGLSPSLVQMTGPSAPHRIVGADVQPFYGQAWASISEEWTPHPRIFGR